MAKIFTFFTVLFLLLVFWVKPAKATETEAGVSAVPKFKVKAETKFDYRVYILQKFLKSHRSPLTPYSLNFIRFADYYDLDYRMVPAIAGVESTFGKHIPEFSFNAYGWAGGNYRFKSWPDSIQVVSRTLKYEYIDKGANSIAKISRIYAPPSKTWGRNVGFFISKINPLPLTFDI